MIKLEDISTRNLTHYAYGLPKEGDVDRIIIEFLEKKNITNYEEVEEAIALLLANDITEDILLILMNLTRELKKAKNIISKANEKERQDEIFTFNTPQIFGIDDKTIHMTDSNNKCSVLPYAHPYARGAVLNTLKCLSIEEAKNLLSKYYLYGNSLKNAITSKRNFGNNRAKKVAELINLYDEQVVRQRLSHNNANDCNLFTLDQNSKKLILLEQLKDIVEYLFDTTEGCIFGELNPTSKSKIASAAISTNGEENERTRTNLISMLSDYTTLEELEKGILTEQEVIRIENGTLINEVAKPIDRFVKVRKPKL